MVVLLSPLIQRITFAFSLITLIFWALALHTQIYSIAVAGAFYELIWLPMTCFVFLLPAISLYQLYWLREALTVKSLPVYSFVCNLVTIAMVLFWEPPVL